jgi:hypothetical protein
MGLLSKITSAFTGGIVEDIANVADKFIETPDEKREFKLLIEQEVTKREQAAEMTVRSELEAKSAIMTAEMNQDDLYTKRARPTMLYSGLVMIGINYILVPLIQTLMEVKVEPFQLPTEFWVAWGGVAGIYSLGRSTEKWGKSNKVSRAVTGNKRLSLLDEL